MKELINGEFYFINEDCEQEHFDAYDIVVLLDVSVDEPLALVQLVKAFNIDPTKDMTGITVLVPIECLTHYTMPSPEPEPEPVPDPEPEEPIEPELPDDVEPEPEPEPVLPNVDDESEEQE